MSTPKYKGPGQPAPSSGEGVTGWLGGFLGGGAQAPAYRTAPPPAPPPCPPCPPEKPTKPAPTQEPTQPGECPLVLDPCDGEAVIPVGAGPITIVIPPRA